MLCFLFLKSKKPNRNLVIWPRLDQKTVVKSMFSANLKPLIVQGKISGDMIITDLETIEDLIKKHKDKVLCVFS